MSWLATVQLTKGRTQSAFGIQSISLHDQPPGGSVGRGEGHNDHGVAGVRHPFKPVGFVDRHRIRSKYLPPFNSPWPGGGISAALQVLNRFTRRIVMPWNAGCHLFVNFCPCPLPCYGPGLCRPYEMTIGKLNGLRNYSLVLRASCRPMRSSSSQSMASAYSVSLNSMCSARTSPEIMLR